MSNSPSSKALLILGLTGALGAGALAYYVKADPAAAKVPASLRRPDKAAASERVSQTPHEQDQDEKQVDRVETEVMVPKIEGTVASLHSSSVRVPRGKSPLAFVAEKCLKESNVDDVKLIGVDVANGTVVLNFDSNIESGMGSNQEGTFLKSLQVAYGQFPNIRHIEIQRENEKLTSLGNIEIPEELNVIRSGNSDHPDSSTQALP